MRLLILFLVLTFIITINSRKPFRPWSQGEKCSKKVTRFCKMKECIEEGNKCENLNKKEPKKKNITKKYKNTYCRNVRCVKSVQECICPLNLDPVCDRKGNYYANIDCALCNNAGSTKEEFSTSFCNPEIGVIGT